jgi:DNA-directed RNA polymerase subunit H (RpoH/RPB5)
MTSNDGQCLAVFMNLGLTTMLRHRNWTTHVTNVDTKKECTIYTLENTLKIICFTQSIRKSDVVSLIDAKETNIMLTGPNISRPALSLAASHDIEVVNDDLYAFDRMKSNLLPTYTIMTIPEIIHLETKHKCTRDCWPTLRADDPMSLYLGIKKGTCLFVTDRQGIVNIRHVS